MILGILSLMEKQSSNFLRNARRIGMLLVSKMAPFRDYQVAIFDPNINPHTEPAKKFNSTPESSQPS